MRLRRVKNLDAKSFGDIGRTFQNTALEPSPPGNLAR
jgi:hypothetical protein